VSETTNNGPLLWLTGDKAGLGPYDPALVESYWRWENDPRVLVGYGQQTPESLQARTEGIGHQVKRTTNQARFTIYDLTGPEPAPVGTTALLIEHRMRIAEFYILIGDQAHRGKGIGTDATRLTLDYGFHVTNLRCIHLAVLAPNEPAIRAYEKAGFRPIGRRRQSGYWLGEPCDELLMDAIPTEFPGPSVLKKQLGETP
jgi:diamine N-acetyltransferase